MADLINGRTPEQIRFNVMECAHGHCLSECPYDSSDECTEDLLDDAHALIEHLEAKAPKWISVEERLPEYKTAVLGYGLRHRTYPETDPFPACHVVYTRGEDEGWFTFWNNEYVAVTHWMPLPEPPEVRA